jgi:hypothetical protein
MNQEEQGRKISQLIAKCWTDESFKQKILADPAATLRAEGLEMPAGVSYVAHENTEKMVHLVIPAKPTDLSDEDLRDVVAGVAGGQGQPLPIGQPQQACACGPQCSSSGGFCGCSSSGGGPF